MVTTTDYTVNDKISRTPQAQVYAQVIQDLKDAETLLNINYVAEPIRDHYRKDKAYKSGCGGHARKGVLIYGEV